MAIQEFINSVITEPAEEPMTLFISYAHREALICRLIVYALKARGHKVWFDELNIPHGSDWRSEILKGIEHSSGVLSMLSQDAVKPGGVCLDELSIAVGVSGGNIRTVLLEQNVTPPPTLLNRQWLDFTEWQNFKKSDCEDEALISDPEFFAWFKGKIRLLIEMLETRENREFEGQITAIRKALPALYFSTSRQMFLLKEYHVERTWLREKVDGWLDDPAGESICIIYGDPGIGKSAFSAHYAHYNGRVATAIFCEKGQNALNSPEAVIQTLAYLLACRIADYREYLANLLEGKAVSSFQNDGSQGAQYNVRSLNADEMFEVLLATPLLHLIDGERAVECILVDGLDEAGSVEKNELASVLQKYSSRLPRWLRILVLSRNILAVQKWFGEARKIDLTAEIRENREDLERFVRERLKDYAAAGEPAAARDPRGRVDAGEPAAAREPRGWVDAGEPAARYPRGLEETRYPRGLEETRYPRGRVEVEEGQETRYPRGRVEEGALEKATKDIVSRSDGVFLYAKITVDALLDGKITLDEVGSFPHGLDQIYLRWFQWYVPDTNVYDAKVRPAMELMAAITEAIPEEEIIAVTGWRRQQLSEFKRLMQVHLREGTNESGEKTIDFNHLFVREWILSPAASEYRIYEDDGILELARFFDEVISDEEPEINEFEARYVLAVMGKAAEKNRSMRRAYREALRNEALMKRQEALGRYCWEWNRFYEAQEYLKCALQIAECRTGDEDVAENRKHIVICKNRLAKVEQSLGHDQAARKLNEEALEAARQNIAERGLPEDLDRAAVSLMMIGDNWSDAGGSGGPLEGGPLGPLGYYREAGELLARAAQELEQTSRVSGDGQTSRVSERAAQEPGQTSRVSDKGQTSRVSDGRASDDMDVEEPIGEKVERNRSIVYNRMGMLALMRQDYAEAASSFYEDLKISQRLAMETGKPEARRDFAVSCFKLAEVYRICGETEAGVYYYTLALQTMEILTRKRGKPDDIRGLIVLLNCKRQYWGTQQATVELKEPSESSESRGPLRPLRSFSESREPQSREPLRSFERALALSREMISKYGMVRDYLHAAESLENVGLELWALGDAVRAKECWKEASDLYAKYNPREADRLNKLIEECEV